MELNWSTFLLEILNFLILVWLLSRFFYRPVLDSINRRREHIDGKLAEAARLREEAESMQQGYEARLKEWQQEQNSAREQLRAGIDTERNRLMAELQEELEAEREKSRSLDQRRQEEERKRFQNQAIQDGAVFTSRLLTRLANAELESTIVKTTIEDLDLLPEQQIQSIRESLHEGKTEIRISSAYALKENIKSDLEEKLGSVLGNGGKYRYACDPALIAGVRISIGGWQLQATLKDELKYFTGMEQHDLERR